VIDESSPDSSHSLMSEKEKRLNAIAVVAGSLAPNFTPGTFAKPSWKVLMRGPMRARLVVCANAVVWLALMSLLAWAALSGDPALAGYTLVGFVGLYVGAALVLLGWNLLLRRKGHPRSTGAQ
jgi:hypothetical protein